MNKFKTYEIYLILAANIIIIIYITIIVGIIFGFIITHDAYIKEENRPNTISEEPEYLKHSKWVGPFFIVTFSVLFFVITFYISTENSIETVFLSYSNRILEYDNWKKFYKWIYSQPFDINRIKGNSQYYCLNRAFKN